LAIAKTGAISLTDIKNQFGGPTSPSLLDYISGGYAGYVTASATRNWPDDTDGGGIYKPIQGQSGLAISFGDYYGAPLSIIDISNIPAETEGVRYGSTYNTAKASINFNSNREYSTTISTPTGTVVLGDWSVSQHAYHGYDYEIKFTYTGDAPTSGSSSVNTWLSMASNRTWISETTYSPYSGAVTSRTTNFTILIRPSGGGATITQETGILKSTR
jgi:hypothetical protein